MTDFACPSCGASLELVEMIDEVLEAPPEVEPIADAAVEIARIEAERDIELARIHADNPEPAADFSTTIVEAPPAEDVQEVAEEVADEVADEVVDEIADEIADETVEEDTPAVSDVVDDGDEKKEHWFTRKRI